MVLRKMLYNTEDRPKGVYNQMNIQNRMILAVLMIIILIGIGSAAEAGTLTLPAGLTIIEDSEL